MLAKKEYAHSYLSQTVRWPVLRFTTITREAQRDLGDSDAEPIEQETLRHIHTRSHTNTHTGMLGQAERAHRAASAKQSKLTVQYHSAEIKAAINAHGHVA